MIDRAVAKRYAEAFVNVLGGVSGAASDTRSHVEQEAGRLEAGLKEIQAVAQVYAGSEELRRFLGSPEIAPEAKGQLIHKVWSEAVGADVVWLVDLLTRRDRVDHLPAVAEEAELVAEARQGLLRGTVTTAHPISARETEALALCVGRLLNRHLILERVVDPAILGGVRIAVGTSMLDGSVRRQLEEIRQQLFAAQVNG